MRKIIGSFAPKSRVDFAWKSVLFCILICIWHLIFTRFIRTDDQSRLVEIFSEAIGVGGPFVLLFMLGSWHQVTAIQALTRRAYFDPLSQIFNRQTFISRFTKAVSKSQRGLLILMDVDHFKRINDQHGHAAGDECIVAIGHRLSWHLRDIDLAGRIGGEEFAIFLDGVSKQHGRAIAERLGQPVSFFATADQVHVTVTLSAGAVWISEGRSVEQLLIEADDALYVAKAGGRAQLRFSDEEETVPLSTVVDSAARQPRLNQCRSNSKVQLVARR